MNKIVFVAGCLTLMALPVSANAQGLARGADYGAREGNRVAGPLGGIVGGAVGAGLGGAAGVFGLDYRPRGAQGRYYYQGRDGRWYRR